MRGDPQRLVGQARRAAWATQVHAEKRIADIGLMTAVAVVLFALALPMTWWPDTLSLGVVICRTLV